MEKLFIERKASDNKYLHKDFHVTADIGIAYVGENYGDVAVIEYLTAYSKSFYKPLIKEILKDGLIPLKKNFEEVYKKEEWLEFFHAELLGDKLSVTIDKCPAVTFMKESGHIPSKWYKETTYTVYGVLAKECGLKFNVEYYNEEDGATKFSFWREK